MCQPVTSPLRDLYSFGRRRGGGGGGALADNSRTRRAPQYLKHASYNPLPRTPPVSRVREGSRAVTNNCNLFDTIVDLTQRVRAEAAEKSRLLRKAKLAMQKKVQRERTAAAAAEEEGAGGATTLSAPPFFEHSSGSVVPAPPGASPASPGNASGARRAERRETVHRDVEVKLGQWRRKRAREEAGLPGDGERQYRSCPAGAGYHEQSDSGGGIRDGAFGGTSLPAGGGGTPSRGEAGDSRVPRGAGGCWRGAANGGGRWPEVFNAPAPRRSMPRPGRTGPFPSAAAATASAGDSGSTGVRSDDRARDAETRWVAPWMVGLVDRSPGVGAAPRGRGGRGAGLVGSEEGNEAGLMRGASDVGPLQSRGLGTSSSHGDSVKRPEGGSGDRGAEGGCERGGLSDLHHEILRFVDYVSLTPTEVGTNAGVARLAIVEDKTCHNCC